MALGVYTLGDNSQNRALDSNNVFHRGSVMGGTKVLSGVKNGLKRKIIHRYIKYPQKHKHK